jgi:hypothetical protein
VTALPEQVRDAALLFDPFNAKDIANAIATIVTRPDVRDDLRTCGFRRLKDFDWERTAKTYRAVYRRAAGYPLNDEDLWLLNGHGMPAPYGTMECREPCQDSSSR